LFSLAWNVAGGKPGSTGPRVGEGWKGCEVVGFPGGGGRVAGGQAKS